MIVDLVQRYPGETAIGLAERMLQKVGSGDLMATRVLLCKRLPMLERRGDVRRGSRPVSDADTGRWVNVWFPASASSKKKTAKKKSNRKSAKAGG